MHSYTLIMKDTCTPMFTAALFALARIWKQLRCLLTWIKKLWYVYSMEYSVQSLSRVRLFATPWNAARQASLSITNSCSLFKPMSIESMMPSSHLILCCPFSSCLQCLPASGSFPMSQLFTSDGQVLEFQLQHQSFQWTPRTDLLWDGLVGSPCSPRDSQESSPAPQFKSINSSALSFLHSPTLTSIHDHWKNYSLD